MNDESARIDTMATEAMRLLIEAVEQTSSEAAEEPSNLEGWTIRDLVGHATGSAAKVVALVEGGKVWGRSEPAEWASENPAPWLGELADRLQRALPGTDLNAPRTSPEGEVPLHRALTYPVSDLALHSWDVHRSQGRAVELPADLLAFCQSLVGSLPEEMLRRPGSFGPAQPAPQNATQTARLMAHLGRSVDGQR